MDYGIPTLIEHRDIAEAVSLCRKLGFQFVEINMNMPMYQLSALAEIDFRKYSDIYFTLHMDENLNPFDFNELVADAYLSTAESAAKFAVERGMPVINAHVPAGVYFTLPDRKTYLFDRYWDAVRPRVKKFRDSMSDIVRGRTKICLENTKFSTFSRLPDMLNVLLESDDFMLTYDCGHDYTDGLRAKPFYEARIDRLGHVHIHDASKKSCHMALGTGEIDIAGILSMAKGCRAVVETKTADALIESKNWLIERELLK